MSSMNGEEDFSARLEERYEVGDTGVVKPLKDWTHEDFRTQADHRYQAIKQAQEEAQAEAQAEEVS